METRGLQILILALSSLPLTGRAQSAYSLNVVGYVDVTFVAGSNLVANPFDARNNTISNLFQGVPDGTAFLAWNRAAQRFETNSYHAGSGWTDPGATLRMPLGGFLSLPSPARISFAGDLFWGIPPNGCYEYAGSGADVTILPLGYCGFCDPGPCGTVPNETVMRRWNRARQDWDEYYFIQGAWYDPTLSVVDPKLDAAESAVFVIPERFIARMPNTVSGVGGGTVGPGALPPTTHLQDWRRTGGELNVHFPAEADMSYTLLRSTNLNFSNSWSIAQQGIASATNGYATLSAPAPVNGMAFYKLASTWFAGPPELLNASRGSTQFTFQFYGIQGTNYAVQRKILLAQSSWQTLTNVTGTNGFTTITDSTATAPSGYYRLQY